MNFFELEHIFVVFPPGSAGNFISNLIRNVIYNTMATQQLSSSGNAHHDANTSNPLGCNVLYLYPNHQLLTDEEKINFYKGDIEKKFSQDCTVKVSWTHDFSNISFYKKLFPNAKFLVVTTDTQKEKMAAMILQELKNTLDSHGFVFVDDTKFRKPLIKKNAQILKDISGITDNEFLISLMDRGRDPENFYLFAYLTLYRMAMYYDLYGSNTDLLEYCITPAATITGKWDHQIVRIIGPKYKDCITEECVTLMFIDIINNNSDQLSNKIEQLLSINLTTEQKRYISSSLKQYLEKQNQEVISNPKTYIEKIKSQAFLRIQELKNDLNK